MQRRYSIFGDQNAATSTTILGVTSATTIRPSLYFLTFGSAATPADQAFRMTIGRFTAAGTATSVTPVGHDPADPSSLATGGYNHTVEPTYTAGNTPLTFSINQQNTYKWETLPQYGIQAPATAANGLGLYFQVVSGGTALCEATFYYAE